MRAKPGVAARGNQRLCVRCAKRRSGKVQALYGDAVLAFKHPALLTLTVPNARSLEELEERMALLVGGFRELRRRRVWPRRARGLWALEVTWSEERGYHPHLHCVVDMPYCDLKGLSAEWERLTGAKHQPDLKRARTRGRRPGLLRYAVKYITKPWDLPEEVLVVLSGLFAGRRQVTPFGGLKAKEAGDERSLACPGCGACYRRGEEWVSMKVQTGDVQQVFVLGPRWGDWERRGWAIVPRAGPS